MTHIIDSSLGTDWESLFLIPTDFGDWNGNDVNVSPGDDISIGGENTQGLISDSTVSNTHALSKSVGTTGAPETNGNLFFVSAFAAAGEVNFLRLKVAVLNAIFSSVGGEQYFNVNAGSVETAVAIGAGSVVEAGIEVVSGGFRCWAVIDCNGEDVNGLTVNVSISETDNTLSYNASDTTTIQLYAGGVILVDGASGDLGYPI